MANLPNIQNVTCVLTAANTVTTIPDAAGLFRGVPVPNPTSGTQIPQGPQRWPI
jgi:hypothetical protein